MSKSAEVQPSIAKNTLLLYGRMAIAMVVGLFTSRIILNALGEVDYGVYNVVGSVVGMLAFLNASLSGSVGRYFTVALGRNERQRLADLFSTAFNMHLALALIMAIGLEVVGVWAIYNKLTIPPEQLDAAFWVLQFSIIGMIFGYTSVPYSASLVSHENMKIYAYMGLYDAFSRLAIVLWVAYVDSDRLVFYAFLILCNSILTQVIYRTYCFRNYEECRVRFRFNRAIVKELSGYSGWDLFGNVAVMCQGAALNVMLNIFFGPVVNAARAIALQIQSAVGAFVGGFTSSSRPRVVKYAAREEYDNMYSLTFRTAKVSYFLMLIIALPVLFNLPQLLKMWLGEAVPQGSATFALIIVIGALLQTYHTAFLMSFHGIGRIKTGNLINGSLMILSLPISYIALYMGAPAWSVFAITVVINAVTHVISWIIIYGYARFDVRRLLFGVYAPTLGVTLVASVAPAILLFVVPQGMLTTIISFAVCESVMLPAILYLGFNHDERNAFIYPLLNKLKNRFCKRKAAIAIPSGNE